MRPKLQTLRLGFPALLLATSVHLLLAAPPNTGIRGQAFVSWPGFAVEVEPGVWYGMAGITMPIATSFTILSAPSGREIGHFATDAGGAFEVPLPPGKYVLVPDVPFGMAPTPDSLEVTVKAKHYAEVTVYYYAVPIPINPGPEHRPYPNPIS